MGVALENGFSGFNCMNFISKKSGPFLILLMAEILHQCDG